MKRKKRLKLPQQRKKKKILQEQQESNNQHKKQQENKEKFLNRLKKNSIGCYKQNIKQW